MAETKQQQILLEQEDVMLIKERFTLKNDSVQGVVRYLEKFEQLTDKSLTSAVCMFSRARHQFSKDTNIFKIAVACMCIASQLHQDLDFYILTDVLPDLNDADLKEQLKKHCELMNRLFIFLRTCFVTYGYPSVLPAYKSCQTFKCEQVIDGFPFSDVNKCKRFHRLGEGTFGCVYKTKLYTKQGRTITVAEKTYPYSDHDGYKHFIREISTLHELRHLIPLVPKVYCARMGSLFMTLGGRSLRATISDISENKYKYVHIYTVKDIVLWVWQLLSVLNFAHKAGISHRDIKPENIVIVHETNGVMIIDWGASIFKDKDPCRLNPYVTTRWYRAPELFGQDASMPSKNDIWSVGCIAAELFSRNPLFPVDSNTTFQSWAKRHQLALAPLKQNIPPIMFPLVNDMLMFDPEGRPTAEDAVQQVVNIKKMIEIK